MVDVLKYQQKNPTKLKSTTMIVVPSMDVFGGTKILPDTSLTDAEGIGVRSSSLLSYPVTTTMGFARKAWLTLLTSLGTEREVELESECVRVLD